MKLCRVHIEPAGVETLVAAGTSLADIVASHGVDFPCGGQGRCGNCCVEILSGRVATDTGSQQLLVRKGLSPAKWALACRAQVVEDLTLRVPEREHPILTDASTFADGEESGCGVAIDLGSTTLVVQLVDLHTGRVLATASALNPQSRHGADIMSRIAFALRDTASAELLQRSVRLELGRLVEKLAATGRLDEVRKVVIVGNSVMHHLFCGFDVAPLSAAPFQSPHNEACTFSSVALGWALPDCPVTFLPNLSHFVGSDILAGIEALRLHRSDEWQALIDLGTNGEIVIGSRQGIVCTSTAAGPAFEGVNISQGMRATTGAISGVDAVTGAVRTVGGAAATGLCGSGLVDAVFYLLRQGRIDLTGTFTEALPGGRFPLTPAVALTQQDIQEYLLAQAAIATGFELLLHEMGLEASDLGRVYVAGGLGEAVDLAHASALGLLRGNLSGAGNTALRGAKRFLYDRLADEAEEIVRLTSHFALESCPEFQDAYIAHLFLGGEDIL